MAMKLSFLELLLLHPIDFGILYFWFYLSLGIFYFSFGFSMTILLFSRCRLISLFFCDFFPHSCVCVCVHMHMCVRLISSFILLWLKKMLDMI